ncbi:MAG: metallophosphoesterase family protein [Pirellulales bacterium]|nr:metallophosphoesterase family protein [Pirellulales bacterium]
MVHVPCRLLACLSASGLLLAFSAATADESKATDRLLAIPQVSPAEQICFVLYAHHDAVLKLTAQLYPLPAGADREVRLEIEDGGRWREIARAQVEEPGFSATFRVAPWDASRIVPFRVVHGSEAFYRGTIRKDPVEKENIVIAAFTGNSIYPDGGGDIPRTDLVENVKKIDPDLLFFSGDQVYDHNHHLAYWLKFGRDFGPLTRDRPTVTIPDDHDVGQSNLWGAGGKKSNRESGEDGGYFKSPAYVREVERAQTSHLPDPFDPAPVDRGIGVYYTDLNVGGISFAILEDRKFKSSPLGLVPDTGGRIDHVKRAGFDPADYDAAGAELLGERQLRFVRHWAADWESAEMKAVLSQTIFCGGAHVHGGAGRLAADLDSNGWPQSGRNRALAEIRKAFAVHIAGDQHLGTVFHHGIDAHGDAGYSFCVPSIANFYLRWWSPETPGNNRLPGAPAYTGEHLDGLGNRITCSAAANPKMEHPLPGKALNTFAAGFGTIEFDKANRTITFNCWPRNVDVTDPGTKQYPGWPITVAQRDNYGRKPVAYLPPLAFEGATDPVVQVIEEKTGNILYTLRIKGHTFQPWVFAPGRYTLHVGEGEQRRTIRGLRAGSKDQASPLVLRF